MSDAPGNHKTFSINDFVRMVSPPGTTPGSAYGIVVTIESLSDGHGVRRWYDVRWVEDGRPSPDTYRHHADELELLEP